MLLSTKDFNKIDERNYEDNLGMKLDIPTVIIKADDGDKIKNAIKDKKTVMISIKYSGVNLGNKFKMELFLRSDDIKTVNFFKEFKYYYERLSTLKKFKF